MIPDQPITWHAIQQAAHVLELEGFDGTYAIEPDGTERPIATQHVYVKWDGCVNYASYANGYGWNHECQGEECQCLVETMHICDLGSFIASLQTIQQQAQEHYGPDFE